MSAPTIFKYPLSLTDEQTVLMPVDAEIVHVGLNPASANLDDCLAIWAKVRPGGDVVHLPRRVVVKGTGHPLPEDCPPHQATVHMSRFMWHVFT